MYIYTHVVRQASCLLCLGCFYSAVGCLHHPISCCHLAATTTHAHDTSSFVTPHHHPLDASFLLVLVPSSFRPPNEPMVGDKSDDPSHRHHHSQRPSPNQTFFLLKNYLQTKLKSPNLLYAYGSNCPSISREEASYIYVVKKVKKKQLSKIISHSE